MGPPTEVVVWLLLGGCSKSLLRTKSKEYSKIIYNIVSVTRRNAPVKLWTVKTEKRRF